MEKAGPGMFFRKLNFILVTVLSFTVVAAGAISTEKRQNETVYNIDAFIDMVPEWVEQFRTGGRPGSYAYMPQFSRPDTYGSTDMFYLLYTLDMLDLTDKERRAWAGVIRKFQDPDTGWWGNNKTFHSKEHATAYAVGALKLLGAPTKYPLSFRESFDTKEEIHDLLETTPWNVIWSGSHIPSGVASALINSGDAGEDWTSAYLDWLDREADPATGYWMRDDSGARKDKPRTEELGGAFHFYYIYTYAGRPLPYPEKIIDTTISLQHDNGLYDADVPYCIDLDGVFSIIHAYRQTGGYRKKDVEASLEKTLAAIVEKLNNRDFVFGRYRDSHKLVGAVVALAEIQDFMPHKLKTPKPLKLVLKKSPFI